MPRSNSGASRDPALPGGRLLEDTIQECRAGRPAAGLGIPADRRADRRAPSLVVLDGFQARTVLRIPTTLDNLIAARQVRRWWPSSWPRRAASDDFGELSPDGGSGIS